MSTTNATHETVSDASNDQLDERDLRALEECLTVLDDMDRARGRDDEFLVVSQSGKEYLVNTTLGECECPDHEYREPEGGCKHLRRVRYAIGDAEVPAGVDADPLLGEHVDADREVMTDGGVVAASTDGGPDEDDGLSIERGGHKLTYLGQDGEGWHHHHDVDEDRILVVDDAGTDVERGAVIYRQIDADAVDHVQDDVQHRDLQRWMAYVELERGWDDRALRQIDIDDVWSAVDRATKIEEGR